MVKLLALKMLVRAGTGGTYSEALQGLLLKSRDHSKKLCITVELLVNWLDIRSPSWAAYWSFMPGCLITLDRLTVVRLVGIMETWQQIF